MGYESSGYAKQDTAKQPCKPDYEKMVLDQKEEKFRVESILAVLVNVDKIDMRIPENTTVFELIGRLSIYLGQLNNRIEHFISMQEKE